MDSVGNEGGPVLVTRPRSRRFRRLLLTLLAVPIVLYCALVAVLYAVQGSLLFRPMDVAPDASAAGVAGLQTVLVRTADRLDLKAWFLPPPTGRPTVLYFHGNGGNLGNRTGRAQRIAGRGWGLMMLEYRGYGGNPGTPSEKGMAMDARAALDALAARGIPPRQVVLYGESLGTGVAARLAADRPATDPVAAVVLDAPYTSVADVAAMQYWFLPAHLLVRNPFDILSRIGGIHAPLLVMQGDHDVGIPPAMGRAVFDAALEPKQMWVSVGGLHENAMETGGEAVMAAFLGKHVPGG